MPKPELDLSLIIACYNEAAHLSDSMEEILLVLDDTRYSYEVIFVDDCSADDTRRIIDQIIEAHPGHRLRKLFHQANTGRGGAVTDGFRMAAGRVAGYIDVDLEVHARYIPAMVQAVNQGADIAVGLRVYKFHILSLDRYLLSKGYTWLVKQMLRLPFSDTETGYKFFDRERVMPLIETLEDSHWFWDTEFMARANWAGLKVKEIPCLFIRQRQKKSSVNPISDSIDYFVKLWRFKKKHDPGRGSPA